MTLTSPHEPTSNDPRAMAVRRLAGALAQWRTENRVMEELIARQVHPDLDAGELDLLTWIVNKAPVSVHQLAEVLVMPVAAVQDEVAELERLDLVRLAEPDGSGSRFITPRPYAVKLAHSLAALSTSSLEAATSGWDEHDMSLLTHLLDRLMAGYDAVDDGVVDELILGGVETGRDLQPR